MKFPAPGLLPLLGVDVFKILPKHWVAEAPDGLGKEIWQVDNVMGSGPFILEEYDKDVVATYERNPNYFKEGLPYFDGMKQFIITEHGTVIGAFKAGQVLMSNSQVSNLSNAESLQLKEELKDQVTVHIAPACCSMGLMMNTNREPFTDPRVRRAINLAMYRQPLITTLSLDIDQLGPPLGANAWWSKTEAEVALLPGYRELNGDKHPDDIAEARRLLAEAGFPDGFKTTLTARTVVEYVDLAGLVKPQLKEFLNIDVDIKTMDSASGLQAYRDGNFDLAVQGHGFNVVGPDGIIAALFMEGGGRNYSNWSNPKIDELFALQTIEFDQEKRKAIVQEVDDFLLTEDTPWVPLYWSRRLWIVDNSIKNFRVPPSIQIGFKHEHLWLEK
jgi:peptide/nickel transport system substrate-binding protein